MFLYGVRSARVLKKATVRRAKVTERGGELERGIDNRLNSNETSILSIKGTISFSSPAADVAVLTIVLARELEKRTDSPV